MKNLHRMNSAKKMLAHGSQNGFGPFRPHPKRIKIVLGVGSTQDGRAEQASSELNYSASILKTGREESQDEN